MMNLKKVLQLEREKGHGWLWSVDESERDEAERIHDEWLNFSFTACKDRHNQEKTIRESIKDWENEPDMVEFAKKARLRYLNGQLRNAIRDFKLTRERFLEAKWESMPTDEIERTAGQISKKIDGYKLAIAIANGKAKNIITDDMIERAKSYPLEKLVEVGNNGRAKCCFHGGDDYNMDIRGGFAFCYVCGASGDAVTVYRAITGCSFKEAVLILQS